jgi:hypothetical protein
MPGGRRSRVPQVGRPAFIHRHVFDASAAPRGQLPYIVDDSEAIGDSDTIIAHLLASIVSPWTAN